VRGAEPGATRRFPLTFPADYHGAEVAGKTAEFEITLHTVEERVLPALDADFVRSVGIADGNLEVLRTEVLSNVEREVGARLRSRTRDSVLEALAGAADFPAAQGAGVGRTRASAADGPRRDLGARRQPDARRRRSSRRPPSAGCACR
jgi:trigger factor